MAKVYYKGELMEYSFIYLLWGLIVCFIRLIFIGRDREEINT